jgi:hypothetical protein
MYGVLAKDNLSEGIAETLINTFSPLPKLRVLPRSRVFRYRVDNLDLRGTGRELNVWLANSYSRRHWCFVQAATMLLPAIGLEVEAAGFRRFYRSLPFQRLVSSVAVEIGLENGQFRF